jgi:hypothetical protein
VQLLKNFPAFYEPVGSLPCSQEPSTAPYRSFIQGIRPGPRLLMVFRNKLIFYGELLAPHPTPKLEDHPLSLQPPAPACSLLADFYTLKMEVIRSSETSVYTTSTWRHIPEDCILPGFPLGRTKSFLHHRRNFFL